MDTVFFFNSSAAKDWHHLLLALTLVLTDAVFSFLAPTLSVYYIQYLPGTAYHSIDIPHITLWTYRISLYGQITAPPCNEFSEPSFLPNMPWRAKNATKNGDFSGRPRHSTFALRRSLSREPAIVRGGVRCVLASLRVIMRYTLCLFLHRTGRFGNKAIRNPVLKVRDAAPRDTATVLAIGFDPGGHSIGEPCPLSVSGLWAPDWGFLFYDAGKIDRAVGVVYGREGDLYYSSTR